MEGKGWWMRRGLLMEVLDWGKVRIGVVSSTEEVGYGRQLDLTAGLCVRDTVASSKKSVELKRVAANSIVSWSSGCNSPYPAMVPFPPIQWPTQPPATKILNEIALWASPVLEPIDERYSMKWKGISTMRRHQMLLGSFPESAGYAVYDTPGAYCTMEWIGTRDQAVVPKNRSMTSYLVGGVSVWSTSSRINVLLHSKHDCR
jgi:hypothetical protein